MDVIHLLPDSVANQIAAGEVIQRPASVVKELVENSIDAGATAVDIVIKDAGRTLIQVIDNGCGMSVTDARMAFERHATSKIEKAADLFSLRTMGFRGEALPSIAAVSEVEMRSMRAGDVAGTRIIIAGSRLESQAPDVCAKGTNIMVKRLFFNLPARRKFLKKDQVEMGHIVREFERLALVNTNTALSLRNADSIVHELQPASLKQRICDLFGKQLDHQLIPISADTSLVRINGFISLPQFAKKRGHLQYFFVNGRNMRHPYYHRALMNCYESLIPNDTQPSYFINFDVDPDQIDVNIHPQKHEVKFENEQAIWQILTAAIKEALGRFNASSAIDFNAVDVPEIPPFSSSPSSSYLPDADVDLHYNPFTESPSQPVRQPSAHVSGKPSVAGWEKLYASGPQQPAEQIRASALNANAAQTAANAPQLIADEAEERPAIMQLKGRYIITPSKSGLMIIDMRRAHVRILFDKFNALAKDGRISSQRLIFPEDIELDAQEDIIASSLCDQLSDAGWIIKPRNKRVWTIEAVPALLNKANPSEALLSLLHCFGEENDDSLQSHWSTIALSTARSAAVKYGTRLSVAEMDTIISDLFRLASPDFTPDGKPIIHILELEALNKLF